MDACTGVTLRLHIKSVRSAKVANRVLSVTRAGATDSTLWKRFSWCQCASNFFQLCRSKLSYSASLIGLGFELFGGRPRRFFDFAGAEIGGRRRLSGTSLACSQSR